MDDKKQKSHGSRILPAGFRKSGEDFNCKRKFTGFSRQSDRSPRLPSISKYIEAFLFLLLLPGLVFSKEEMHMVRGRVIDASTNQGLAFANILVENTDYHTSTNLNGEFGVPLPLSGSKLVVSYVGYKTETIRAHPEDSPVMIRLNPVGYAMSEVNVVGENSTDEMLNSFRLGSAQIKDFAMVLGDPIRSLQLLPGVSTDNELSARVNVRGGTWDENMVLINGAEVFRPYHLNEMSMSSIGVFNLDLVKSIDFSAGGFGAKYGNALSSIININYKEGNRSHFIGTADLGVTDLSASFQGPIDQNGSFIVAARGSYLGFLLQKVKVSQGVYAGYYDIQGNIDYDLSNVNKLKVTFIYSKDNASQDPTNSPGALAYAGSIKGQNTLVSLHTNLLMSYGGNYSSSMLSIGLDNVLSDQLVSRTLLSYSGEEEHQWPVNLLTRDYTYDKFPNMWSTQSIDINMSDDLDMKQLSLNQELDYQVASFLTLEAGAGIEKISIDYVPNMCGTVVYKTNTINYPDTSVSISPYDMGSFDTTAIIAPTYGLNGYLQQTLRLFENLKLNLGVRFDYFDLDKQGEYSPRASLSYLMPLGIGLNAAWGTYYQLPNYDQLRTGEASGENTQFQKATHYVLSLEKTFAGAGRLSVDFYQKYYSDLISVIRLSYGSLYYGTKQNNAIGFAKGMDLQWAMSLKNLDLSLSYSYLVAKEKTQGVDEDYYPRVTDQRHTASVAVALDLGDEWMISMKGFYGSGYAYTPYVSKYNSTVMMDLWVQGDKNSSHYPPYERVDLRVTKTVSILNNPLQLYLDVTNVLNRRNVLSYNYTYDQKGNLVIEPILLLGTVPTIGVNYTFGF